MALASEMGEYSLKASIPVMATAATVLGMTLQDWMYVATIVYTVTQLGFLVIPRVLKFIKARKNGS